MSMTGDYPNRSDLRNPATRRVAFTGQTYGEGAAQQRSQALVAPGSAQQDVAAQQMAARIRPGARPLGRPTERPDEPITAGAPFGPGPGPEAVSMPARIIPDTTTLDRLMAIHARFPNDRLNQIIRNLVEG